MSGDSNNVFLDLFAGLLEEDMEEEPVTVNSPPPTASSEQHSNPPLPCIPPPETPEVNPREPDRVAEEPTEVEPKVDPVVAYWG